jgi:hypothetical protein
VPKSLRTFIFKPLEKSHAAKTVRFSHVPDQILDGAFLLRLSWRAQLDREAIVDRHGRELIGSAQASYRRFGSPS